MDGRIDDKRPCRAEGCLFLCEHNDGLWVCPDHGEQTYPEYETANDPPESEPAELGRFR